MLVLTHSKYIAKRAQTFLCSLLVCLGLHINFSKSELYLMLQFSFLGLCWDTVDMSASLLSDNLTEIQQLAHALLQRQPITVCQVMFSLDKAFFYARGHAQLHWLYHFIHSDMLNIYHSPAHLFLSFHLSIPVQCQLKRLSHLQQSLIPLQFPLPYVLIVTDHHISFSGFWGFHIMWHLGRFCAQGAYWITRTQGCCTHSL